MRAERALPEGAALGWNHGTQPKSHNAGNLEIAAGCRRPRAAPSLRKTVRRCARPSLLRGGGNRRDPVRFGAIRLRCSGFGLVLRCNPVCRRRGLDRFVSMALFRCRNRPANRQIKRFGRSDLVVDRFFAPAPPDRMDERPNCVDATSPSVRIRSKTPHFESISVFGAAPPARMPDCRRSHRRDRRDRAGGIQSAFGRKLRRFRR